MVTNEIHAIVALAEMLDPRKTGWFLDDKGLVICVDGEFFNITAAQIDGRTARAKTVKYNKEQ